MSWLDDVIQDNLAKDLIEKQTKEREEARKAELIRSFKERYGQLIRMRLTEIGSSAFANSPDLSGEFVVTEKDSGYNEYYVWGCDSVERSKSSVLSQDRELVPWSVVRATYQVGLFVYPGTPKVEASVANPADGSSKSLYIDLNAFTDEWLRSAFTQLIRK